MFVINDNNYYELKEEDFDANNTNVNSNGIIMQSTKENFIMLFDFLKFAFDDIVEKINSEKNYLSEYQIFFIKKILEKIPNLLIINLDVDFTLYISFFL